MVRSRLLTTAVLAIVCLAGSAQAQTTDKPFTPTPGMAGKDAVWVPTSESLVERMLDMAAVTPDDYVIDLGSGDGRMVIAAAKRGARALGVEYNPDLVTLSKALARKAGVSDKVRFVRDDMFAHDISKASVLALFLLSDHLRQLTPTFLDLAPGTRIVVNTFGIPEWPPDRVEVEDDCQSWCEAKLYIVPARVAGTWQLPRGVLELQQSFQEVSGTLRRGDQSLPIQDGIMRGAQITFTAGGDRYEGRVTGRSIEWTVTTGGERQRFTASRQE